MPWSDRKSKSPDNDAHAPEREHKFRAEDVKKNAGELHRNCGQAGEHTKSSDGWLHRRSRARPHRCGHVALDVPLDADHSPSRCPIPAAWRPCTTGGVAAGSAAMDDVAKRVCPGRIGPFAALVLAAALIKQQRREVGALAVDHAMAHATWRRPLTSRTNR